MSHNYRTEMSPSERISQYWRRGFNTYDIARFIGPLDNRGNPTQEALVYKVVNDWLDQQKTPSRKTA
jgi:hypothetical protein